MKNFIKIFQQKLSTCGKKCWTCGKNVEQNYSNSPLLRNLKNKKIPHFFSLMFLVGKNNKISTNKPPLPQSIHFYLFIYFGVCAYIWPSDFHVTKYFQGVLGNFILFFSFSILLGSHIGDHPQEELAKFSYKVIFTAKKKKKHWP
jgi:hypothetical protein